MSLPAGRLGRGLTALGLALVLAPAWAGGRPNPGRARAEAQALADSQQQVVALSNQLQGLQERAEQSRQVLAGQDRQIARLKAALAQAEGPATARSH